MNISCIRNRRAGDEFLLNFAMSSYTPLRCAIDTPISNRPWDCGVEMRNIYRATFDAVKYLSIHRTTKWCIRRNCKIRQRITCCSPICYAMNFHRSAVEKGKNQRFLAYFSRCSDGNSLYHKSESGGNSAHNYVSFSYTSFCCVINAQILNCPRSYDGICLGSLPLMWVYTVANSYLVDRENWCCGTKGHHKNVQHSRAIKYLTISCTKK